MALNWVALLWLVVLVIILLWPLAARRLLLLRRAGGTERFGRGRNSRVLTLIAHRETDSLLGFFDRQHESDGSPEAVLRAIARTPERTPIDLILHTGPGHGIAAEQIAHALIRHPARVTVFVPYQALGSGLLIALAANEIVLDPNAVLGPVTPWVGPYPAAALVAGQLGRGEAPPDEERAVLLDQARRALGQTQALIAELLQARKPTLEHLPAIAARLVGLDWTPAYPILIEEARLLGLPVVDTLPAEIHALLELYDTTAVPHASAADVPLLVGPRAMDGTRHRQ